MSPLTDSVSRAQDSYKSLKGDFTRPLNSKKYGMFAAPLRAGKVALDTLNNAGAIGSGVTDAVVGRPIEAATGGRISKRTAGDMAQFAIPFLGEARGLSAAGKAAQKAEAIADTVRKARSASDPVKQVDNKLFQLGGHATADKIEAQQFLKSVPKEASDPKVQAELYDEIEKKLVDPTHQVPEHLQPAMKAFEPWYKEQTDIINRIRSRHGGDAVEDYTHDQGYVARRVAGKSPVFDATDTSRDPIANNRSRSLARSTTALKGRQFFVSESPTGERVWQGKLRPDEKPGAVEGSEGWTVKPATTSEIEANSDTRYHKNAMVNTVDNVLRLRRTERNLDALDDITKGMKDQGLAHRTEWTHPNAAGERVVRTNPLPEDKAHFEELPHIPQLKGWAFDPKIAEVLKDYRPGPSEPIDNVLHKVNRALTASLFVTPIPHAANVGAHWITGRGWDWIKPGAYRDLAQTGAKAVKEVMTLGPEYKRMLREGSGMLYGDTETRNFHQLLMQKAAGEVERDPMAMKVLGKAMKLNPVDLMKSVYKQSNRALWAANDVFLMQRQLELEKQGMSTADAIAAAEKDIPNYRIPSRVMGSRAAANFMKSSPLLLFGRYKYGQLKAWGEMFQDMFGHGGKEAQIEAAGKFMAAMMTSQVAYPIADAAVKAATGNKDARVKRAGPFSLTDAAGQWLKGQKDSVGALSSLVSPSPIAEAPENFLHNQDAFGRKIIEGEGTPTGKAVQAGEFAASQFYPAQLGIEATKPGGVASAAGKLAGLELPAEDKDAKRETAKEFARRRALARERKDPIQKFITGNR